MDRLAFCIGDSRTLYSDGEIIYLTIGYQKENEWMIDDEDSIKIQ